MIHHTYCALNTDRRASAWPAEGSAKGRSGGAQSVLAGERPIHSAIL